MSLENYKIFNDLPSSNPGLGFNETANALSEVIERSEPHFAMAIFGGWGSGKTTLMGAIQNRLDIDYVIPVSFSAWRYESEEHLIVPMLYTIRDTLNVWGESRVEIKDIAHKTASTIGKVASSILSGLKVKIGFPGVGEIAAFDGEAALKSAKDHDRQEDQGRVIESIYYSSFKGLNEAIKPFLYSEPAKRIVVFIDDLDRCSPKGTFKLIESMKLFFDIYGFIFVVGLDRKIVEWCVETYYFLQSGELPENLASKFPIIGGDYIKKIFQVYFTLSPLNIPQMDDFFTTLNIENHMPQEQEEELRQIVGPHLLYLVKEASLSGDEIALNPREIKQFLNSYIVLRKINPLLDPQALITIRTIYFRPDWQVVRRYLESYGDVFIHALRNTMQGDQNAIESLNSKLSPIPKSFLAYISPDAPGEPILNVTNIQEYLLKAAIT